MSSVPAPAPLPAIDVQSTGRDIKASRAGIVVALVTVYVIWGSTYLGIRVALEGFPPLLMSGIRFLIAGSFLYRLARLRGIPNPTAPQWRGAALVAVLLLGLGNGGVTFAEQWVTSSLTALALGATPIWAALFAGFFGRWPSRLEWCGLALGFTGLVILNLDGSMQASPLGALLLVLAPAGWALAYLIVFGALVSFTAYSYLLSHVRPALATSYAYVNPVVAVVLGVSLAGDPFSRISVLAMPVILSGVVLVLLGRERP